MERGRDNRRPSGLHQRSRLTPEPDRTVTDRLEQRRRYDQKRRQESPARAWYKSKAWAIRRRDQLANHPTCCLCDAEGVVRIRERMVVDHHPPHRGDYIAFFQGPVRTLCQHHHNSHAQAQEIRGFSLATDESGFPSDPEHPFNTGAPIPKNRNKR